MMNIKNRASKLLIGYGVPTSISGYDALVSAVCMVYADKSYLRAITTRLYPDVATDVGTTASKVERNVRHAIVRTYDKGVNEAIENIINPNSGNVTNSEFISYCAEMLRLKDSEDKAV